MKTVISGESINFTRTFINSVGNYIDPPSVKFSIVKNITTILYGPYEYDNSATPTFIDEGFSRLTIGTYSFAQVIENVIVPGIYSAKWEGEIDGVLAVSYEEFQVVEPPLPANRIIDPSSLQGNIIESPLYNDLSLGATDRLVLIGHANGLELNVPHRVINIQETINILGADADSPLVRGMLEAYNCGARDIWLVASAPMSEYLPFDYNNPGTRNAEREDLGGLTFYQKYSQRLDATYEMLRLEDFPEIVVPLEAPFYDSGDVDFLTPLLSNCLQRYRETGNVSIGIIGSRIGFGASGVAEALATDRRISRFNGQEYVYSTKTLFSILKYHYGIDLFTNQSQSQILDGQDLGKFGMIVIGEGVVNTPQIDLQYTSCLSTCVAALMSTRAFNESVINKKIPRVANLVGYKFSKDEIKTLARQRVNTITLSPLGRRGSSYETFLATDNTLANGWPEGQPDDQTPFWSISTVRLVGKISQQIVSLGNRSLGTIEYASFRESVKEYLDSLTIKQIIRDFSLNIYRAQDENRTVYVDLSINPFFSLREIYFTVKVGPGTGE